VIDLAIAVVLTALSLLTIVAGAGDIGSMGGVNFALVLLQTMPLAVRRRWPIAVFLITLGATVGQVLVSGGLVNSIRASLGALIALFTVAERYQRRESIWAVVLSLVVLGALIVDRAGFPAGLGGLVQTSVAVVVSWVLGTWSRERRAYVDIVEERAAAAELRRAEEARQAVAEERERIARELHDVVTHHVSVMVIQAGAAEMALDRQPAAAREALKAIGTTGRQALSDMRTMLGILGRGSMAADSGPGEVQPPMPGLDRLGELIESVRAAGMPVELTVVGDRPTMHPGVELSAYRIVQEALTNSLKHARGARSRVTVRYEGDAVELTIDDEGGRGPRDLTQRGNGRGLIGMRERATVFGGRFSAGPTAAGFRVEARLPVSAPGERP
jgi:signal transduction histidine kinase